VGATSTAGSFTAVTVQSKLVETGVVPSVTVTCTVEVWEAARLLVVPEITPVDGLMASPPGSPVAL
jgi:hypothetical protein